MSPKNHSKSEICMKKWILQIWNGKSYTLKMRISVKVVGRTIIRQCRFQTIEKGKMC